MARGHQAAEFRGRKTLHEPDRTIKLTSQNSKLQQKITFWKSAYFIGFLKHGVEYKYSLYILYEFHKKLQNFP